MLSETYYLNFKRIERFIENVDNVNNKDFYVKNKGLLELENK